MEKILFFRRLLPVSSRFGFKAIVQISAFKVTDERIKGTLFGITMFEELVSEISAVKITPCFVGVQLEIKLKTLNRREYCFTLPELGDLVSILKKLNVHVDCDQAVLDRELRRGGFNNNPIVKAITLVLAISFLIFIIYNIFISSK